MTANGIAATSQNFQAANSLISDIIDAASQKTLASKTRDPLSDMPYAADIAINKEPHDVASFFRHPTYCIRISIGTKASLLRIVACLLHTGTTANLTNK